jgi:hypothetical protein
LVGSESGQKQSAKYAKYAKLGRGGEVKEKIEGQQYTRIVPSSIGATVHKLGQKYHQ